MVLRRGWHEGEDRQRYHDAKAALSHFRLFLHGYSLVNGDQLSKERVLEVGAEADKSLLTWLRNENIHVRALGSVVKAMKKMQSEGKLDTLIR